MTSIYDKKKFYESNVAPLVLEIQHLCEEEAIPYYFTAAIENTASDTSYITHSLAPTPLGLELSENHITKHINVSNGFETVPPEEIPEMNFETNY